MCKSITGSFIKKTFITVLGALILFWASAIIVHGTESKQFGLFFSEMNDFFADFTNVVGYSSLRDPYNNEMYTGVGEKAYPPLVYVVSYFFSRLVYMQPYYDANYFRNMYCEPLFLFAFIMFVSLMLIYGYSVICNSINGSWKTKIGGALVMLLSGPMLFAIERGNIIICVPFLCLSFFSFYDHENKAIREIGLICLAIAAGIKITPAVLGLLLVYEKKWKEAARTIAYGLLFFFAPFLFFKGGLSNFPLMLRNLGLLMHNYGSSDGCTIRNVLEVISVLAGVSISSRAAMIISYLSGLLFCLAGFFITEKRKRILLLCITLIMVPNYSGYYCAIYLIPAIVFFLNNDPPQKSDVALLAAFIIILSPVQTILQAYYMDYHLGFLILLLWAIFISLLQFKRLSSLGNIDDQH